MFYLSTRQAEQLWCTCSFGSGFGFRKAGNWHPWNPWNPWSWSRHLCLQGQPQFSFGRLDQASATDLCKRWRPKFRHPSQLHGQDRLCFLINKWYLRFLYVWSFFSFPKTPRFFGFLPGNACRFQVVFCDSFVHCDQIAVLYHYIIVYNIVLRSCAEILSHPSKPYWAHFDWHMCSSFLGLFCAGFVEATRAGAKDFFLLHCAELAGTWDKNWPTH